MSAKMTLYHELKPHILKDVEYGNDLFGTDFVAERPMWVLDVTNARVAEAFNTYCRLVLDGLIENPIKESYVGQKIVITWGYDYSCIYECAPLSKIIERIWERYNGMLTEQK